MGVYTLLVAATLLVVAGTAAIVVRSHFEGAIDAQLAAAAHSFQRGPAARARGEAELLRAARGWLAQQPVEKGDMAAVRIGDHTVTSAGDADLFEVPNARELLSAHEARWWDLTGDEGEVSGLTVPLRAEGRNVGTLVVLAYSERAEHALSAVLAAVGWASALGVGFAVVLGFLIVRRTLRPLERMTRQVEAVEATGDLSRRVAQVEGDDEVGRLAGAFDRMLARLEQAFRTQQRLLADASHELRTPLTVARGQLELLADELGNGGRRRLFSVATDELDRMARIVEDLLLLARLDEGLELVPQPVEVELVLREALLRAMLLQRRSVRVEAQPGLYALADPDHLLQAVTNLVTNAFEHTSDEAVVTLCSTERNGCVVVSVSDTGCGIPAQDLPHVFERLYRGGRTRARAPRGAGLGLAITASLVEAMNGSITVESVERVGTTVTIALPLAPLGADSEPVRGRSGRQREAEPSVPDTVGHAVGLHRRGTAPNRL